MKEVFPFSSFVRSESNGHGEAGIDGGYSQQGGWHVGGHATWTWAKQQEEANKGSASVEAGYGQRQGFYAKGTVKFTFAKENGEVETLYVTEIATPNFIAYLPSYSHNRFDNLAEQLKFKPAVIEDGEF